MNFERRALNEKERSQLQLPLPGMHRTKRVTEILLHVEATQACTQMTRRDVLLFAQKWKKSDPYRRVHEKIEEIYPKNIK